MIQIQTWACISDSGGRFAVIPTSLHTEHIDWTRGKSRSAPRHKIPTRNSIVLIAHCAEHCTGWLPRSSRNSSCKFLASPFFRGVTCPVSSRRCDAVLLKGRAQAHHPRRTKSSDGGRQKRARFAVLVPVLGASARASAPGPANAASHQRCPPTAQ